MANDMMIAALQRQRAGKMDPPASPNAPQPDEKDPQMGMADRVEVLEEKIEQLMKFVGMKDNQEAPKEVARGY